MTARVWVMAGVRVVAGVGPGLGVTVRKGRGGGDGGGRAGTPERDAWNQASLRYVAASRRSLGERRLADRNQQVMLRLRGKHVVLLVQPRKLGFEIAYSLLQAAHL